MIELSPQSHSEHCNWFLWINGQASTWCGKSEITYRAAWGSPPQLALWSFAQNHPLEQEGQVQHEAWHYSAESRRMPVYAWKAPFVHPGTEPKQQKTLKMLWDSKKQQLDTYQYSVFVKPFWNVSTVGLSTFDKLEPSLRHLNLMHIGQNFEGGVTATGKMAYSFFENEGFILDCVPRMRSSIPLATIHLENYLKPRQSQACLGTFKDAQEFGQFLGNTRQH